MAAAATPVPMDIDDDLPVSAQAPPPELGSLWNAAGEKLATIPSNFFPVDDSKVEAEITPEGLKLTFGPLEDHTQRDIIRPAQRNVQVELQRRKQDLAHLQQELEKLMDPGDDEGIEVDNQQEMANLMGMRAKHLKRIKELESQKKITITFKRRHGVSVVLTPGVVTPVTFSQVPLIWCPKELADEVGGKEEIMSVAVDISPSLVLQSKSRIFADNKLLEALATLFDYSIFENDLQIPIELIHTEQEGASASQFDAKVKNKKDILVVIKASTQYVFGAFIHDKFGGSGGWIIGSDHNFVFTLGDSRQDPKPLKLAKTPGTQSIHISSCGFHVGSSGALVAFCSTSTNFPNGDFKPAPGFEEVQVNNLTVAGCAGSFSPVAIEVYQVGHMD